jgi:aminopeptidase N
MLQRTLVRGGAALVALTLLAAAPAPAAPPSAEAERFGDWRPAPVTPKPKKEKGARPFDAGALSGGDPLFPEIGNGGYDAQHYALELSYDPPTRQLAGTTTMRALALQGLTQFSLDLQYYDVSRVVVNGRAAQFRREGTKLVVTPAKKLHRGFLFTVATTYAGTAQRVIDPDGSSEGFVPTPDGAFVVNQPIGAQGWFPNNNVPRDKATFDIAMTVPADREVQATGRLVSNELTASGQRRWHWRANDPTATYLTTATVGDFDWKIPFALDSGQPFYQAIDVLFARRAEAEAGQARSAEIIDWIEELTGRAFPWEA